MGLDCVLAPKSQLLDHLSSAGPGRGIYLVNGIAHSCQLNVQALNCHSRIYPPCRSIERSNLLALMQLVIKSLIESSMRGGRTLTDAHPQLQQFLIVMEHSMRHRLKGACPAAEEYSVTRRLAD